MSCSFCGKSKDVVDVLVSSPDGSAGICDTCLDVAIEIANAHWDKVEEKRIVTAVIDRLRELAAPEKESAKK